LVKECDEYADGSDITERETTSVNSGRTMRRSPRAAANARTKG
jgi:hypothetical protein